MKKTGKISPYLFLFLSFVLLAGNSVYSNQAAVTASVNATKIGLDDTLTYTLSFQSVNNPVQPNLTNLKDWRIVQTSQSSQFSFINGQSSHSINFVYILSPQKKGQLTIPAYYASISGNTIHTEAFTIDVVEGSVNPAPQSGQSRQRSLFDDEDVFSPFRRNTEPQAIDIRLVPEISKKQVLKGEPIIFKILLYARNRVESVNMISNQSIPGFWQEWFPIPKSINAETKMVDGKQYQVYEIRKAALFPSQSGELTIPSLKFEISLLLNSMSFFADNQQIFRSTPQIKIIAKELPQNALGLPVGNFSIYCQPITTDININDILNVKVIVQGTGNIKTLKIPEFEETEFYKPFPAKISSEFNFQSESVSGKLTAEIPISFKKNGEIILPPLELEFFDPEKNTVVIKKTAQIPLLIKGQKESNPNAMTLPQTQIIRQGEDISFIRTGTIDNQADYLYQQNLFWIVLLIPFLLTCLFFLKIMVLDRMILSSSAFKQKKLLNETLAKLSRINHYGQIASILDHYMSHRTRIGLSELSNQRILQLLENSKLSLADREKFLRIKEEAESAHYSPLKKSPAELKNDISVISNLLKRIDGIL